MIYKDLLIKTIIHPIKKVFFRAAAIFIIIFGEHEILIKIGPKEQYYLNNLNHEETYYWEKQLSTWNFWEYWAARFNQTVLTKHDSWATKLYQPNRLSKKL